jgi:hypothetical protein
MKTKLMINMFLGMVTLGAAVAAHAVPILNNGSLTGPIANFGVPSGWTIIDGSPDTMDENHNVGGNYGGFGATPSPSPDGGTWVGIGDDGTSFNEVFGQSVSGFDVGTTYNVSWYQANFGYTPGGYINPDSIALLVDSVIVGNSSISNLVPGWTLETVSFTATSMTQFLSFGVGMNPGESYLSIDGITIAEATTVPEPSTLVLLGLGLAGLGLRRRQQK